MTATRSGRPPPAASRTTRALRLVRLAAHLAHGWMQVRFTYPRCTRAVQLAMIRDWSRRLLDILGVSTHMAYEAGAPPSPCMMVANHISWLDAFVINAHHPVRFITKAEVRAWPLVGTLAGVTGALFIERVKRRDAHRINEMIGHALGDGGQLCVFPESTTTEGDVVRHFHANLLQAAIDRNALLQPIALQYLQADGARAPAAAYVGEQTLAASLLAIVAQPSLTAKVGFLAPISPRGRSRRQLARSAEAAIAAALDLPVVHTASATPADPRV